MLSFFPRGVLDEILNLIESVSEDFSSYSPIHKCPCQVVPVRNTWVVQGDLRPVKMYLMNVANE